MARFTPAAAATLVAILGLVVVPSAAAQEWASINLGTANVQSPYTPPQAGDTFGVALISEASQGHADLNDDGDGTDLVPFVVDSSGALTNLHLAMYPYSWYRGVAGDAFLFAAHEGFSGGRDLNGDGDAGDEVLHLYTGRDGRVTNLRLAVDGFLAGDPLSVLLVPEWGQGGTDLNGDLDAGDRVAHLLDVRTGEVTNLGLAVFNVWSVWLAGDTVAFGVYEPGQGGKDFNGDGDRMDGVLVVGDAKRLWSTRLASRAAWTNGQWLACPVYEASQGSSDLNGDGDSYDEVLHLIDLRSREVVNEGLALGYVYSQELYSPSFSTDRLVFGVGEARQGGTDLDGDGDASDVVAHLIELEDGQVRGTRLALSTSTVDAMAVDGLEVALLVSEAANGGRDLNGDGDVDDDVLHVVGANLRARPWNIGLAAGSYSSARMQWTGGELLFLVPERGQRRDLNGDDDAEDVVLHRFELESRSATSTGMASGNFAARGGVVTLAVAEAAQGFDDLDGDGLVRGEVAFALDLATSSVENLGYTVETYSGKLALGNDFLLAPSREPWQLDRNGDGDWSDDVLVLARRSPLSAVVREK
jgi:hypothetical protein